ncbi:MAG: hypothetical protein AB7F28_07380 [Candidatus Margulisiibacteriota bacterium]
MNHKYIAVQHLIPEKDWKYHWGFLEIRASDTRSTSETRDTFLATLKMAGPAQWLKHLPRIPACKHYTNYLIEHVEHLADDRETQLQLILALNFFRFENGWERTNIPALPYQEYAYHFSERGLYYIKMSPRIRDAYILLGTPHALSMVLLNCSEPEAVLQRAWDTIPLTDAEKVRSIMLHKNPSAKLTQHYIQRLFRDLAEGPRHVQQQALSIIFKQGFQPHDLSSPENHERCKSILNTPPSTTDPHQARSQICILNLLFPTILERVTESLRPSLPYCKAIQQHLQTEAKNWAIATMAKFDQLDPQDPNYTQTVSLLCERQQDVPTLNVTFCAVALRTITTTTPDFYERAAIVVVADLIEHQDFHRDFKPFIQTTVAPHPALMARLFQVFQDNPKAIFWLSTCCETLEIPGLDPALRLDALYQLIRTHRLDPGLHAAIVNRLQAETDTVVVTLQDALHPSCQIPLHVPTVSPLFGYIESAAQWIKTGQSTVDLCLPQGNRVQHLLELASQWPSTPRRLCADDCVGLFVQADYLQAAPIIMDQVLRLFLAQNTCIDPQTNTFSEPQFNRQLQLLILQLEPMLLHRFLTALHQVLDLGQPHHAALATALAMPLQVSALLQSTTQFDAAHFAMACDNGERLIRWQLATLHCILQNTPEALRAPIQTVLLAGGYGRGEGPHPQFKKEPLPLVIVTRSPLDDNAQTHWVLTLIAGPTLPDGHDVGIASMATLEDTACNAKLLHSQPLQVIWGEACQADLHHRLENNIPALIDQHEDATWETLTTCPSLDNWISYGLAVGQRAIYEITGRFPVTDQDLITELSTLQPEAHHFFTLLAKAKQGYLDNGLKIEHVENWVDSVVGSA